MPGTGDGGLIEGFITAKTVPVFRRFFVRHAVRMIRRRFHAGRILKGDAEALRTMDLAEAPTILLLSHPSWWDPLVGLVIWHLYLPSRDVLFPMDATQLARFPFFRRVGSFGIDPESWLLKRSNHVKLPSWPSSFGIAPESWLLERMSW